MTMSKRMWERRSAWIGWVLTSAAMCSSSAVGPVAQWQEHLDSIRKVPGLNPSWIPDFQLISQAYIRNTYTSLMEESLVEEFCTSFVRSIVPRPHPQGERVWCHKPESLGLWKCWGVVIVSIRMQIWKMNLIIVSSLRPVHTLCVHLDHQKA